MFCCNGEAISTRIRRRTCYSKIKTYDEFNSEDAFGRVVFNFIKPDIKILGNLLQETIDQGNLIDRHQQVIQNWIMTVLGLLKSGKLRLRRTIDQSNLIKLLGEWHNTFVLITKKLFSTEPRNP